MAQGMITGSSSSCSIVGYLGLLAFDNIDIKLSSVLTFHRNFQLQLNH